jgi:hypothetical protein
MAAYKSTDKSVAVYNAGWGGSQTADWVNNPTGLDAFDGVATLGAASNLMLIALGTNDINNSVAQATFLANMNTLYNKAKTATNDVLFVIPHYMNSTLKSFAVQDGYWNAFKAQCDANGQKYFDCKTIPGFETWASSVAAGYMGDANVHLSAAGADAVANGVFKYLMTAAGQQLPWTPLDLGASLIAYWDAERGVTLNRSGALVNTWADAQGGLAPAQGVSGAKPQYDPIGFNGRPGVSFDGIDDYLNVASTGALPAGSDPCEIWALVDQKANLDATTRRVIEYGAGSNSGRLLAKTGSSSANDFGAFCGSGAAVFSSQERTVNFLGRHVIRGLYTPTTVRAEIDGVAAGLANGVPATATTRTALGSSSTSTASAFFQGMISAVIITGPLTSDQAAKLAAFLKTRGGTP